MNLGLEDRVALVTGSSRGIGRAIAAALHREGCYVVLNGRDLQTLEKAAAEFGGRTMLAVADVTDPSACRALVNEVISRLGRLDILVCNVGTGTSVPPGAETPEEWRRMFDLNFFSATNMVEAARTALSATRGTIVCVSSICGLEALGAPLTYSAAKAALNAYVRGVSRPLARLGVRINAVAPGNILFDGSVWERKLADDRVGVETMLAREVPLGRFGRPEEVADCVAFLASPRSAFATGSIVVLDGGQLRAY